MGGCVVVWVVCGGCGGGSGVRVCVCVWWGGVRCVCVCVRVVYECVLVCDRAEQGVCVCE